MKLLKETYKTYEGARKRAAFENGVANSEFAKGCKAHIYRYTVELQGNAYRVARHMPIAKKPDATSADIMRDASLIWKA